MPTLPVLVITILATPAVVKDKLSAGSVPTYADPV